MNDVFESSRLYAQLDDLLGLSHAQLSRLMSRAEQHPEAFKQFDLPRLAIGCRPGDRAAIERLLPLLQHPQVRAHPGWIELAVEVASAMESYSLQAATTFIGDLDCSTVREVLDAAGLADWLIPWLQPAVAAALLEVAPSLPVRLLKQHVAEACADREQECLERFVACFGVGDLRELVAVDDLDEEDDADYWLERWELAECIRKGWASPDFISLTLRWPHVHTEWQRIEPAVMSTSHEKSELGSTDSFRRRVARALPGLTAALEAAAVPTDRSSTSGHETL